MMIENDKSLIRADYKTIRSSVKQRSEKENIIVEKLETFNVVTDADIVLVYAACGSEVNIDSFIKYLLSSGKTVALPVCLDKTGDMDFYYIDSLDAVEYGMYGIREPERNKLYDVRMFDKSVCIVPAVCFDKSGMRIGYGKGYYDRFLERFNGNTIGVSFEECVAEKLPHSEYDKKVDYLITDKNIYNFFSKEENTYG